MNTEKRDFDKEAASWDENPARVKMADDVTHAMALSRNLVKSSFLPAINCSIPDNIVKVAV